MDPVTEARIINNTLAAMKQQLLDDKTADHVQKCHKYAKFFKHTSAGHANAIYWSLFVFVIVLLAISSLLWSSQDRHSTNYNRATLDEENQHDLEALEKKKQRSYDRVVLFSILCFLVALPVVIVEAFAGIAITFCHKEDFPFLYWGVFFLLSVGSLIAIMGLSVGTVFSHRRPPWNLSLGTPVLVIAGIAHLAWDWGQEKIRHLRGKSPKTKPVDMSIAMSRSRSRTRSVDDGKVVADPQHGTILQTLKKGAPMPDMAKLVGHTSKGERIVEHLGCTNVSVQEVSRPTSSSITLISDAAEVNGQ